MLFKGRSCGRSRASALDDVNGKSSASPRGPGSGSGSGTLYGCEWVASCTALCSRTHHVRTCPPPNCSCSSRSPHSPSCLPLTWSPRLRMLCRCQALPAFRRLARWLHASSSRRRDLFDSSTVDRLSDQVDVCIVGAGPAGVSAAIRLKQLEQENGREIRVFVLENGAEVGAHTLLSCASIR